MSVARWRMDVGPASPDGVLLELSVGADVERWPIDRAQATNLVSILLDLLRQPGRSLPRVA
ncbi:hypothetical protein [Micromonospora zhanjiangensis]|uniref:Uncharacterized protein n=1 Tax=Micromonospora zhanjiangensis TaxID=1522057 RepID=A0ABV8KMP0_9ACTN